MKINGKVNFSEIKNNAVKQKDKVIKEINKPFQKIPAKAKTGALVALFLLPTLGVVNKYTNKADSNKIVVSDESVNGQYPEKYVKIGERTFYVVKSGDNPKKIASNFDISVMRLLAENSLKPDSYIHPNDTLLIPESYKVKNVRNLDDVSRLTGLSRDFLNKVCELEGVHNTVYTDRNGNKTIGIGHVLSRSELGKYKNKKLSEAQIYTLFAQDLIDKDLNLKTLINEDSYKQMPKHLKESVIDLIFNKGEGALRDNKNLLEGLNDRDYVKAVSNLNQDFSVVITAKGEKIHKPASGLCKRRLFDIQNASKIFKNGIPTDVLKSAKKVYENGLKYMKQENERGEFPNNSYQNVLSEYKAFAYKMFDGKIGEAPKKESRVTNASSADAGHAISESTPDKLQSIYVEGKKTKWTVKSLYADWERTAESKLRPFKRPLPVVDKNGNITAEVKIINPKKKGPLSGKTILINPGHGGCVGNNGNVNFDPGTSNAVMSRKNRNIETNVFKGNGGKALEEWIVNKNIAEVLADRAVNAGAKVIYVQGSVYTAMNAIRKIQRKNKVHLVISLHSNSDADKRGIYIISNRRKGVSDKEDKKFAKTVVAEMNKHSWFRGITQHAEQSLGVLSSSSKKSSPVPGVLIETGNLKNETDVANLNSADFKNQMIESIFEAVKDYLK